jgi:hypothetical protein
MIPRVRLWTIKLSDGRRYNVLAPTKRLAILNLRDPAQPGTWGAIDSVWAVRAQPATLAGLPMVSLVESIK